MKTIEEIRLANARYLIKEAGSQAKAVKITGREQAQLSHIAGKNPKKYIGSDLARALEGEFGREIGWMDHEHDHNGGGTPSAVLSESGLDYLEKAIYATEVSLLQTGVDITPSEKAKVIAGLYNKALSKKLPLDSSWLEELR